MSITVFLLCFAIVTTICFYLSHEFGVIISHPPIGRFSRHALYQHSHSARALSSSVFGRNDPKSANAEHVMLRVQRPPISTHDQSIIEILNNFTLCNFCLLTVIHCKAITKRKKMNLVDQKN